ncbi:MAG: sulfite oxidase heme-binding subunit YedZ [Gammaproteobacteria bacterium]
MSPDKLRWICYKTAVFLICLTPFLWLLADAASDRLGANPIETLHFRLGDWALRFLCIGLALTPIRTLTGKTWVLRYRRMMGLYAFFYASMHLLVFVVLDQSLSWEQIKDEVPKSPYIIVGLLTYTLLLPLALTSTKKMQQRLGRNWKKLHRLVYAAAVTAVIHYLWLVKSDYREPLFYAAVIAFLLGFRIFPQVKKIGSYGAVAEEK